MDQQAWNAADETVDEITEKLDELLDSPEFEAIRSLLVKLKQRLGDRYGINLTCVVDVVEWEHERCLPLLNTGISISQDGEPYRTWNDSSPQRYVVDGEIRVVPDDYCPKCWGPWSFKWLHRSCSECGTTLGENCEILLDSDVCPHCERGSVSMTSPTCEECGFTVDPTCVMWG